MSSAVDAQLFLNISSTTSAFKLNGGYYMVACIATFGGGNVGLQILGPDQSTWLSAPTALKFTANGTISGYLPPGQYRFAISRAMHARREPAGFMRVQMREDALGKSYRPIGSLFTESHGFALVGAGRIGEMVDCPARGRARLAYS